MEVLVCRTPAGTLSLRALTSLASPVVPPWPFGQGFLMSPARPSLTLNRGKLPSRVLDSPRRREKVKPVDARGGRKEGEFKQACLIDASVFFSRAGCSLKRFRATLVLIRVVFI